MDVAEKNDMNRKRILHLICLILMLLAGRALILFMIEPVDYSIFFNRTLKNKAKANGNHIDMVFLGSSRPQRTFDPEVFEKTLGLDCVYNASSGLQPIEASYYMLREIADRYSPEYAVLGITGGTLFNGDSTLAKVIVLDRLHGSNKLEYLKQCFRPDEYLSAVSLIYRFRNNFTIETIRETVREKINLYKTGFSQRQDPPDLYKDNGFVYSYQSGDIGNIADGRFDFGKVVPENRDYLDKIVDFCKQKNIRLFLVTPPSSMMNIYNPDNYQEITDYFSAYASEHGLHYVNLNYLKGREEWLGDRMMYDSGHVNGEGAILVSERYARTLDAVIRGEKIPDLFYGDISELKAEVHRILAVAAKISIIGGQASVHITSRQTDGIRPLYRVSFSLDDENYVPWTDWTGKTDFVFDMTEYRGTAHFLIEAISPSGEPGSSIRYHVPI